MEEFELARRRYMPEKVRFVLVAEAPPRREAKRFFYFENVNSHDTLFLETMKVLYPGECGNVRRVRATKRRFLERFRDDGFYLVDACREPMQNPGRAAKLKCLRDSMGQLKADLVDIGTPSMKVVLISATVYEVCRQPLKSEGWNVINSEMIDFPGSGRQRLFREKLGHVLEEHGWNPA